MKEHKGEIIWLHSLYIRICKKYSVTPEAMVNEEGEIIVDKDTENKYPDLNEWHGLFTFPENSRFETYIRYHSESEEKEKEESTISCTSSPAICVTKTNLRVEIGDRVKLKGDRSGIVKYIGKPKFAKGEVIGLELDTWDPDGHMVL